MVDLGLQNKHCVPCEGTEKPFTSEQITRYMPGLSLAWDVVDGKKLRHTFRFKDFVQAMAFVNRIAPVAEAEGHHPDIHIYYGRVMIELRTHVIGGLSENDFILAEKIEFLSGNGNGKTASS